MSHNNARNKGSGNNNIQPNLIDYRGKLQFEFAPDDGFEAMAVLNEDENAGGMIDAEPIKVAVTTSKPMASETTTILG